MKSPVFVEVEGEKFHQSEFNPQFTPPENAKPGDWHRRSTTGETFKNIDGIWLCLGVLPLPLP